MEGATEEQDLYDQSFIDVPAILDKHKAAAEVCQGKYLISTLLELRRIVKLEFAKIKHTYRPNEVFLSNHMI